MAEPTSPPLSPLTRDLRDSLQEEAGPESTSAKAPLKDALKDGRDSRIFSGSHARIGSLARAGTQDEPRAAHEIARRRTFAIISPPGCRQDDAHPKNSCSTAAPLQLAGSVTARKDQRATTSDWMELERQRGISHFLDGAAVRIRRLRREPARHAGPQGFFRGYLPRAHGGSMPR